MTAGASPSVVMMCGLPASGKTTTAGRLGAKLGGVLIRSCDVYRTLSISLPEWVQRTRGFTVGVAEYDRLRDAAYGEMVRRAEESLAAACSLVIVDAVFGEPDKRRRMYEACRRRGATPLVLLCRCDDWQEIGRRFGARVGLGSELEHEASDLAVFRYVEQRWQDPRRDRLADGAPPTVITCDTGPGGRTIAGPDGVELVERIRAALEA